MKRIVFIMILLVSFIGISMAQNKRVVKKAPVKSVVEVMYFHSKQGCPTCKAIGKFSKEVVTTDFAALLKSGQVRYKDIDISTTEGEKIADKYRVTWSSLFVNQWKNGKEQRNDMTRFGFENARNNTAVFKAGLKSKINQLLK
jgi:thiol-disulfide isomerase/thioredoxin